MKIKIDKDYSIEISKYPVCGKPLKILEVDDIDDGKSGGEFSASKATIKIGKNEKDNFETFVHEFLHAVWDETGHAEGLEEKQEESLNQGTSRHTVKLFRYMFSKLSRQVARKAIDGYKQKQREKRNKRT